MKKLILFFVLLIALKGLTQDNLPEYWQDIQSFKKQDSVHFPAANSILLIGSSSFTYWKDVQDYFPGYPIINRGFGGSTLLDQIRYAQDIIFPYNPKQIIIYCGENDIAADDAVTPAVVFTRFQSLYFLIRSKYPKVQLAYISMKPSPSRQHLMPKYKEANKLIRDFLRKTSNNSFVNVYDAMLKADGTPMTDIFREDRLHMTAKGYKIWQGIMKPYLVK